MEIDSSRAATHLAAASRSATDLPLQAPGMAANALQIGVPYCRSLAFYRGRNLNDLAGAVHEELARYWALAQDLRAAEAECRAGLALVENNAPTVTSLRLEAMLAVIERSMGNPAGDKRLRTAAQGLLDLGQGFELLQMLDYLLQEAQSLRREGRIS